MVFIVWATENAIEHVFTELQHVLDYIKTGARYDRVEVWNKNRLRGLHY